MKRTIVYLTLAISCVFLMACNEDKNIIMKSAYGYLNAMGNYQIDKAKHFATEETQLATLKYISEVILPVADTNYIKSNTPANIEIIKVEFKNDTVAMVSYNKHTPIKRQEGTLEMRKRDDQWLAHVIINNRIIRPIKTKEQMDSIGQHLRPMPNQGEVKALVGDEANPQKVKAQILSQRDSVLTDK